MNFLLNINKTILLLILVCFLSGCGGNSKVIYDIDEIQQSIKNYSFNNLDLIELDYDTIDATTIIVDSLSFGSRDILTNETKSSQRILCYSMDDGTLINIVLGELPKELKSSKDIITLYTDDLKNISANTDYSNKSAVNVDSTVFLMNNILINTVAINTQNDLNTLAVVSFKEELVKYLSTFSK